MTELAMTSHEIESVVKLISEMTACSLQGYHDPHICAALSNAVAAIAQLSAELATWKLAAHTAEAEVERLSAETEQWRTQAKYWEHCATDWLKKADALSAVCSKWQPMETAPKDGTPFLGWCQITKGLGDGDVTPDAEMRVLWWEARGQFTSDRDLGNEEFTHWMPLPAPPNADVGEAVTTPEEGFSSDWID